MPLCLHVDTMGVSKPRFMMQQPKREPENRQKTVMCYWVISV